MPPGFYNCEKCGWSGSKLSYFGYDSEEKPMTGYDRHPQFGQGQCPNCRTHFEGCVHPDRFNIRSIPMTKDEIRALGEGRKTQVRIVIENCDPESLGPDPVDRPNPYKPGGRLMIRGSDVSGSTNVSRSVSLDEDLVEGLVRVVGENETSPSRIILYNGRDAELEEIKETLEKISWEEKEKIKFLIFQYKTKTNDVLILEFLHI